MTLRDASSRYPLLEGAPMGIGPAHHQPVACRITPSLGCRFTVTLEFARGRLDQVTLDSDGTAHLKACNDRIKAALSRQYGGEAGGFSTASNPHGYSEYASWGGPRHRSHLWRVDGRIHHGAFFARGSGAIGPDATGPVRP